MCYTTDEYIKPKTEVTYNASFPYGTVGYRSNCNNIQVSSQSPVVTFPNPLNQCSVITAQSEVQTEFESSTLMVVTATEPIATTSQ